MIKIEITTQEHLRAVECGDHRHQSQMLIFLVQFKCGVTVKQSSSLRVSNTANVIHLPGERAAILTFVRPPLLIKSITGERN